MTSSEIRKNFLDFFAERGHMIVSSSSLLPDDPSVLLTAAGMQQFKPYFTGNADPDKDFGTHKVCSVQKSFRTSDIDAVGDESHLTFFEMLGNFSFGPIGSDDPSDKGKDGYYKHSAIYWGWELLNLKLKIKNEKLFITIFKGEEGIPRDEDSLRIWQELGIPKDKIFEFGKKDNFWGPTGEEGPCGPTTEIHYDLRGDACEKEKNCIPNCECGRFTELWNIVFNEYYQDRTGKLTPLENKGVDTGLGLERLVAVLQRKSNIFETDLFMPIILEIKSKLNLEDYKFRDVSFEKLFSPGAGFMEDVCKLKKEAELVRALRIIADHLRGAVFLIADGVLPSNLAEGYILRRLIRRSIRFAKTLDLEDKFYVSILSKIINLYGGEYPELKTKQTDILTVFQKEEEKFTKSLNKGLREFQKMVSRIDTNLPQISRIISGKDAFYLYETYGFPLELTQELAQEQNLEIDVKEFDKELKRHQELSRVGLEKKFGGHGLILDTGEVKAGSGEEVEKVTKFHTATHLLHQALRDVLGKHVQQMGSDINPERLRFDFSHSQKITPEEIKKVEDIINQKIKENLPVEKEEMDFEEAIKSGALAFFKTKYPQKVNVYSIGSYSKEVCGGPHIASTGELGKFRITKEESSSAGVRRIRAILE